jgi:hypothetical protein
VCIGLKEFSSNSDEKMEKRKKEKRKHKFFIYDELAPFK